ncbi:MAG: PaaI family thioesterase [Anaerolineales bacterium]|jgi:acyl-coenzyme A thioesterase PaaI-like protein
MTTDSLMDILHRKFGDKLDGYLIPPPVFSSMEGEFVALDMEAGTLETRFPVLERFLNPYHALQGGIIAAAVDNTLGPLSMLLAPANVTRRLEMKYSYPVQLQMEYITVQGKLVERKGRKLIFKADVRSPDGLLLARARAAHWIVD